MTTNREWLYSLDVADLAAWFDEEHDDGLAAEKVVSGDAARSNDANAHLKDSENLTDALADSREKLERDIDRFLGSSTGWSISTKVLREAILGWLDRQAAIAERKCIDKRIADQIGKIWESRKVAELQAQVDNLAHDLAECMGLGEGPAETGEPR